MAGLDLSTLWEDAVAVTAVNGVTSLTTSLARLSKAVKDGRRSVRGGQVAWMQRLQDGVVALRVPPRVYKDRSP